MNRVRGPLEAVLLLAILSCARPSPSTPAAPAASPTSADAVRLPPVPAVRGRLDVHVTYPGPDDRVDARDSSFLLGTTGTGDATLSINGMPVPVAPNGAWLAWLPLPPDSVMRFELVARTGADSAAFVYLVRRPAHFMPPAEGLWIDTTSITPRGRVWLRSGAELAVSVRASEGATVRLRLPGGTAVSLPADPGPDDVPAGIRAFDRDSRNLARPARADRYTGVFRPWRALGGAPGPVAGPPAALSAVDTAVALLEVARGIDTVRVRWPVQLALLDTTAAVVQLDDDSAGTGTTDSLTIGRALPGGTYYWFFPTGTRAAVLGRVNNDLHLRLSAAAEAWVPAADAHLLAAGRPTPRAVVGSVTLGVHAGFTTLRIPVSERVPFRVSEGERSLSLVLYGAVGDVDWMRYGPGDSVVRRMSWTQSSADEVRLDVVLARPVWGYRTRWEGRDLLLDIRRPPTVDATAPLRGRLIVVDPGHPPGGATGPTGLREAEPNLAIGLELRRLLAAAGARVMMTRVRDTAVELLPRTRMAERVDADLLVSIHNNALPDGVNPFTNNGTSVFYNQPHSVPLAQAVQRALVAQLGLRDLGIGRGDLALVRPTWMPSILCEGLYMIVPEQEAALRSDEGRRRYAQGVFDGLQRYLQEVAGGR